jgi:hypothetical protein
LALAGTVVAALCAAIGKLWADNVALRKEAAAERARAQEIEERTNREHKRDLRWTLGMPTSLDPPPRNSPPPRPPRIIGAEPLVRDERPGPPRPGKKPRK